MSDDGRSSNRLSGFFAALLRRDYNPPDVHHVHHRPPDPDPPRSATPPPLLPPPSLPELGLTLHQIAADLSSSPPSAGAFLAPHYLLLCHAQGLDVLPIVSPPAPHPYALIRRVSFKSVVVMEHRGVLVAIAGRRDGVRVYALEEVKKAIEWRMDTEVRRERDRQRRETSKASGEKLRRASLSSPSSHAPRPAIPRKASTPFSLSPDMAPTLPLMPRPPVPRSPTRSSRSSRLLPFGQPPPYPSPDDTSSTELPQIVTVHSRAASLNTLLGSVPARPSSSTGPRVIKTNWEDSSDDEAIDIVAAGASGSQALDERTSATHTAAADSNLPSVISHPGRGNRPANLDCRSDPVTSSPATTLLTLRRSLSTVQPAETDTREGDVDEDEDDTNSRITLVQALLESRIPDLPPIGTRRPQQPILISASQPVASADDELASPRTSEGYAPSASFQSIASRSQDRRRRWSVIFGGSTSPDGSDPMLESPATALTSGDGNVTRSPPFRSPSLRFSTPRPSTAPSDPPVLSPTQADSSSVITSRSSRSSRLFSRILNGAFHSRRTENHSQLRLNELETSRKPSGQLAITQPPPKLEYVKLPGTKGSLLVKAVETPKKSFLAILCGENGEKVELFAGTYRTALGLSRTFILPDSPRSLELQLQGDDLVEVFLVFSQNVFGLEPATVRVREVRIGRAERRAARRRAREMRANDNITGIEVETIEEETNVNVNVAVAVGTLSSRDGSGPPPSPALIPAEHPSAHPERQPSPDPLPQSTQPQADEILAVATAQMGPYTTFQQLSFAPKFPLASIADEYVIPPTYPDFIEYRDLYESDVNVVGSTFTEQTQAQFSPPGLPVPPLAPPSKWYYRDPKGVMHGPWKASLMQAWYKDGLLPLDLPVRSEEDISYTLLRDLRLQSVDPTHPFRTPPPQVASISSTPEPRPPSERQLLPPISLLAQPRHFGPPALFYSSRGGHSTAIVDARGRSVLKGRFIWSNDHASEDQMGDVKRLEALDIKDRSVLVAMRQGGLEVVDLRDALLRPADESRTALPQFNPAISTINRRAPFVWKIGTPLSTPSSSTLLLPAISKPTKKSSTGLARSPAGRSEFSLGDSGPDYHEVLFLGRKGDDIYLCERNASSFRILRLCPQTS
ncbi:hypothetical protein APHAL10511_006263 [Amanita phalloides]|nr:hypothetical protein APHAL10511_006263 [Amanita phalloides]